MTKARSSRPDRTALLSQGRDVLCAEAASIELTESLLDDAFCDAVEAVLDCTGRICVTGVGKARIIGEKIQATMASTGTPAYPLHPVEALHGTREGRQQ